MEQDDVASAVEVRRGLKAGQESSAAELYWDAFGRKLGYALGPAEKGKRFLAAHINLDRAIVAEVDGHLIGIAGYQHDGRALTSASAVDVLRMYGWVPGLPRLLVLAILERRPRRHELLMDGIVVEEGWRGHGVGSRLLSEIASLASELGYSAVGLDVVDTNPGARALYERVGYEAIRTERTPYLQRLMGFTASTTMRMTVEPSGGIRPGRSSDGRMDRVLVALRSAIVTAIITALIIGTIRLIRGAPVLDALASPTFWVPVVIVAGLAALFSLARADRPNAGTRAP